MKREQINNFENYNGEGSENRCSKKNILIAIVSIFTLVIVLYISFFPIPSYETIESGIKNAESIEDIDMSFLSCENIVSEEHQKAIEKTREIYTTRRNEIETMLVNSSITDDAVRICKEKVASGEYGENAEFGGYSWFIPESENAMDITLTASEADEILFLYSCLYDMDFTAAASDFYDKWLYGDNNLPPTVYPIEAFGNTYYFRSKGGYFLEGEKLKEAKALSYKAGMNAVEEHIISKSQSAGPLAAIFSFFIKPFESEAYAEDTNRWIDQIFTDAYLKCYDSYCAENGGSAFIDTVIYTGVSDQMPGEITFSLYGEPAPIWEGGATSYEGTIEDFIEKDFYAQAIVNGFVDNPLSGKLQITVFDDTKLEEYVTSGGEYTMEEEYTYSEYIYDSEGKLITDPSSGQPVTETRTGTRTVTKTPAWEEYMNSHIFQISIQAYPCKEMLDFVFQASINASGITNSISKLLHNSYADKGNTNWRDYKKSGEYIAWCAKYVATQLQDIGLDITSEGGCGYWHSVLTGERGTVMKDDNGNPLSTGDICRGYPEYPMSDITSWGGNGYTPQIGDIVLWRSDGEWRHIGYVVGADDWSVTISNGNNGDMVQWGEYTCDDGLGLAAGVIIHVTDYTDIAELQQLA